MMKTLSALFLLVLALAGTQAARAKDVLELYLVSPATDGSLHYGRRTAELDNNSGDPDTVARRLLPDLCPPALLHSTSWRWQKDGTLILTYLAYSEAPGCATSEPASVLAGDLLPPQITDPLKPRPAEIRELDVLAHGLRHITFLVRYSADGRIRQALSPASLEFFQGLCGQLAGRLDSAREFSDCAGPAVPAQPGH